MSDVRYLVFDIETISDGKLIARIRYPSEGLTPEAAIARYRDELLRKFDTDFVPYTFQVPISIAVAKVDADFELLDLVVLDPPQFRPHKITEGFWRGWEHYKRPTLVSFNGRSYDLPVLELAAFRYGISAPAWFGGVKSFEQPRNRYNVDYHLDLHDLLTNFGASRFTGGLNLAASILGKPGKMDVMGYMVQDYYQAGKLQEINDYCRCDVLDTYFVFLRSRVLVGRLTVDQEKQLVLKAKDWLVERATQDPALQMYLTNWGEWENPWEKPAAGTGG